MFTNLIYMYKQDSALNNLQWLIYHKTKPNQQTKPDLSEREFKFGAIVFLMSLFNGISTFVGYLIPKPPRWRTEIELFNP